MLADLLVLVIDDCITLKSDSDICSAETFKDDPPFTIKYKILLKYTFTINYKI